VISSARKRPSGPTVDAADHLADQMTERLGVLAHDVPRRPVGRHRGECGGRPLPVGQRHVRHRHPAGGVAEQVPDQQAVVADLGPDRHDPVVERDGSPLDEPQEARSGDRLDRRPRAQQAALGEVSGPHVDDELAAHEGGDGDTRSAAGDGGGHALVAGSDRAGDHHASSQRHGRK
jgi:hypothetical protein